MKKILILILSLFMMVGLFADDPPAPTNSFDIYTEVEGQSLIKVVGVGVATNDPTTYSAFNTLTVDESIVKIETIGSSVSVKKLAYFSNQKFTVTMTVDKMTGTTGNEYKINYSATCGGTAYTNPTSGQSSTVDVIKVEDANTVTVGAKTVSVIVDKTDFDNAPTDTYTGTITFATTAP